VMAQSLFITLRNRYPEVAIDVLAPQWSLPLLARMPEVRRGIALATGHRQLKLLQRYRLGRELRAQAYDWAIVLPRSLKAALVPYWARIPRRTGFRGEWRYGLINDMRGMTADLDQTVKKFVALGLPQSLPPGEILPTCPQPKLTVDPNNRQRLLQQLQLDTTRPVVGIMPGAEYGPSKQWPPAYFAAIVRALAARDVHVWIFGSQKDSAVADQIIEQAGGAGRNLCGRTQLADAVDLISLVSLAVSNDSGLMHIAAAVQRPLLALYGSTSPAYTPPLTQAAVIFYRNIECSPCFQRTCPYGHYRCLKEISVDEVLSAVYRELRQ
jgi:heptosyltransferase-2